MQTNAIPERLSDWTINQPLSCACQAERHPGFREVSIDERTMIAFWEVCYAAELSTVKEELLAQLEAH